VTEGYGIKSDPHIVIISTPNKLGDYFEQIDKDPNPIFKKISVHYTPGLNKIYNSEQIEREKLGHI
jgi:hypothetical protein